MMNRLMISCASSVLSMGVFAANANAAHDLTCPPEYTLQPNSPWIVAPQSVMATMKGALMAKKASVSSLAVADAWFATGVSSERGGYGLCLYGNSTPSKLLYAPLQQAPYKLDMTKTKAQNNFRQDGPVASQYICDSTSTSCKIILQ